MRLVASVANLIVFLQGVMEVYDVLDVARYVINYSNECGYGISNLKLQKVLYFIQAYFLTGTDSKEPCFSNRIEAWDFGPVVPKAYHEFKQYGSGNIPKIDSYIVFDSENIWNMHREPYSSDVIATDDRKIIAEIVDNFSNYSASDLVDLTHRQAPWRNAYIPYRNREITIDAIRGYFS